MSYLVDSNVLSKLRRKAPNKSVQAWFSGRPLSAIDSLLAATAAQHGLVLVTRHVRDFAGLPVQLLDPWAAAPA